MLNLTELMNYLSVFHVYLFIYFFGFWQGAGTRGGNGKCKCHGGYKGDLCDVCKKGFYEAHKNESDILCVGTAKEMQ